MPPSTAHRSATRVTQASRTRDVPLGAASRGAHVNIQCVDLYTEREHITAVPGAAASRGLRAWRVVRRREPRPPPQRGWPGR